MALEIVFVSPPIAWQSQSDDSPGRMFVHSAVLPRFFLSPMYMFPARIQWVDNNECHEIAVLLWCFKELRQFGA